MSTFQRITEARKLLGLTEQATMTEIKSSYRKLIRKYHPDKSGEATPDQPEMAVKIIAAYRTIMAYCNQYRFSFEKEEVQKYLPDDEWWFERFGNDPLWGKKN
jgi:preprotein translocase subunit Sec63